MITSQTTLFKPSEMDLKKLKNYSLTLPLVSNNKSEILSGLALAPPFALSLGMCATQQILVTLGLCCQHKEVVRSFLYPTIISHQMRSKGKGLWKMVARSIKMLPLLDIKAPRKSCLGHTGCFLEGWACAERLAILRLKRLIYWEIPMWW